jgi:hypothetical protein
MLDVPLFEKRVAILDLPHLFQSEPILLCAYGIFIEFEMLLEAFCK